MNTWTEQDNLKDVEAAARAELKKLKAAPSSAIMDLNAEVQQAPKKKGAEDDEERALKLSIRLPSGQLIDCFSASREWPEGHAGSRGA